MQFRYYGAKSESNYPDPEKFDLYEALTKGTLLRRFGLVTHIGIQGDPGTIMYINGGTHPIRIGKTGIYELDLEGKGQINMIKFCPKSLIDHYDQQENDNMRLLIDIVYEGVGE